MTTAIERVAAFVAAAHKAEMPSVQLLTADVATLVGSDMLLLRMVALALRAVEGDEETRPDYTAAEQMAAGLDEDMLMRLVVLFNEAGAVAYRAYSDKRRTRNIAEMRAREETSA